VEFTVLTVPLEFRERVLREPGWWMGCVGEFVRYLEASEGAVFAYYRGHPCGEDGETFHPHACLVWVRRRERWSLVDVEAARGQWAKILGHDGRVNLHQQFVDLGASGGVKRLRHHVRYMERVFAYWHWRDSWARWYGRFPRRGPEGWSAVRLGDGKTCPVCGERYAWRELSAEEREELRAQLVEWGWGTRGFDSS
jgi:hypothetical protein